MGYIIDISKYQKTELINWSVFSKGIDLLIARLQYGQSKDSYYTDHITNAKKYNIPVNSYVFPSFDSVDDARVEAKIAAKNHDKDSEVLWVDIESEYDKNMNPKGITKLSKSARLQGIQAYVDELRKNGEQKVGAYIAHNVYEPWGMDSIIGIFDVVWIPRYGKNDGQQHIKPSYPCHMWQYTSVGKKDGYNGSLDMSVLTGLKPLDYFTGKGKETPVVKPVVTTKPNPTQAPSSPTKKVEYIKQFQSWLNDNFRFHIAEDNLFGNNTKQAAIKALQTELNKQYKTGLKIDGVLGDKTKSQIRTIQKGDKGNLVRIIQGMLYCLKYDPNGFDGIFGQGCEKAIKLLQKNNKLSQDGKVGKQTFSSIFK